MRRITPWQLLIICASIAVGALVDRSLTGNHGSAALPNHSEANAVDETSVDSGPGAAAAAAETTRAAPVRSTAGKKTLATILGERDPRQRGSDLQAFINGLGASDFADVLKRLRKIGSNSERELATRLLVARWVQTDPEAALNFASSNRGYEYIADDVFQAEAATDLQGALNRAKGINDPDLRYMALRGVLSFIADSDAAAALGLAQSLGNFPGNEPLSSVIYRQWATTDPQAAAMQAAQNLTDGNSWQSPVYQVARAWAAQDPQGAANWAISLTDPTTESRTISQVMRQWARDDMTAAANWVNSLPPGASYDSAAGAIAFAMAGNDPKDAVAWADNIAEADARTNALQRVSREVMWRDPTNGLAILQAAGVPPNLIPAPPQRGR